MRQRTDAQKVNERLKEWATRLVFWPLGELKYRRPITLVLDLVQLELVDTDANTSLIRSHTVTRGLGVIVLRPRGRTTQG